MKAFILTIYILFWVLGAVASVLLFQAVSELLYIFWGLITTIFVVMMILFTEHLEKWGILKITT